jgi:hypothetical protein
MKHRTASLTLAATLATIAPAFADTCHFDGRRWVCVQTYGSKETLQQFMLEKYRKAIERALAPPGGWRQGMLVPPQTLPPVPSVPTPPPAAAPAPAAPQSMTQQQWKDAIIAEAQRFCDTYPTDPICHFKDR